MAFRHIPRHKRSRRTCCTGEKLENIITDDLWKLTSLDPTFFVQVLLFLQGGVHVGVEQPNWRMIGSFELRPCAFLLGRFSLDTLLRLPFLNSSDQLRIGKDLLSLVVLLLIDLEHCRCALQQGRVLRCERSHPAQPA